MTRTLIFLASIALCACQCGGGGTPDGGAGGGSGGGSVGGGGVGGGSVGGGGVGGGSVGGGSGGGGGVGGGSAQQVRVLGQPNATSNLNLELGINPLGVELTGGKLIAADYPWRVLIWNSVPATPTQRPDVVIGQKTLTSLEENPITASSVYPTYFCESVGTDGTRLFLADGYRNRAMVWSSVPTSHDAPSSLVLGQPNATTGQMIPAAPTAQTLATPCSVFSDGTRLYLADFSNHRVLIWTSLPTSTNAAANLVLGQPNLTSNTPNNCTLGAAGGAQCLNQPTSVWSNGTRLFVSDNGNHRVLVWNAIPTASHAPADLVLGQSTFAGMFDNGGGAPSASTLKNPRRVTSDGTRLFVVDQGNHRVLIWNTLPAASGAPANVVLGQPDFASVQPRHGAAGPDDKSLESPMGIATDGTRLIVGDTGRLMIWNAVPTTSFAPADRLWGRPTFTSVTTRGDWSAKLQGGGSHAFSDGTRFFVTGARTLIWDAVPADADAPAARVLGTSSLTSAPPAFTDIRAETHGVVWSGWGDAARLALIDTFHHRVLVWSRPITASGQGADLVLGQPDFTSGTPNNGGTSASSLRNPQGMSSDGTAFAIADTNNNRVLVWTAFPTTSRPPASLVLGQADFTSSAVSGMNRPVATLLAGGKLYVTDRGNNRVLVWNTVPSVSGAAPDLVLGQADMSSGTPNAGGLSASSLSSPGGLALLGGRLYVADTGNHRVLGYALPVTTHAAAAWVFGQPDFTSNAINNGGLSDHALAGPPTVAAAGAMLAITDGNDRVLLVTP